MVLVIIALLWVAFLTPMAIRRFRDRGTERSIDSFHAEHEVLSRQGYVVPPVHRLDEDEYAHDVDERPRLTVVHDDDTYRSLETRSSWDEWSRDYDYDREEPVPVNRYAAAYASVPRDLEPERPVSANRYASAYNAPRDDARGFEAPMRRRSMKEQRKMIFTRLVLAVVVATTLALVMGYSILVDVAILTWVAVALYVAAALYAVAQGYLDESAIGLRLLRERAPSRLEPVDAESYEDESDAGYDDSYLVGRRSRTAEPSFSYEYEGDDADSWRRESSRYALG